MWRCTACARDFTKAGPYAIHMKRKHGRAYQSPVTEPSEEPEQEEREDEEIEEMEPSGSIFSDLLDKSRELRRTAARLDEIANKIERLFKEAEELM